MTGLLDPHGVAVDWIGKKIYWTDAGSKKIEMSEYDRANPRTKTVYRGQLKDPFSIAVHPVIGYEYFSAVIILFSVIWHSDLQIR